MSEASVQLRYRVQLAGVLDAVNVDEETWVVAREGLVRLALADGTRIATDSIPGVGGHGRFTQSSTLPNQPVWHGSQPLVISPGKAEATPGQPHRSRCRSRRGGGCCGTPVSCAAGASTRRGARRSAIQWPRRSTRS